MDVVVENSHLVYARRRKCPAVPSALSLSCGCGLAGGSAFCMKVARISRKHHDPNARVLDIGFGNCLRHSCVQVKDSDSKKALFAL